MRTMNALLAGFTGNLAGFCVWLTVTLATSGAPLITTILAAVSTIAVAIIGGRAVWIAGRVSETGKNRPLEPHLAPGFTAQPLSQRIANRLLPPAPFDSGWHHKNNLSMTLEALPRWRRVAIALLLGVTPWGRSGTEAEN